MVQVKDVSADMGAAAIGLSLTFTNLEEVQTERRGEGVRAAFMATVAIGFAEP